MCNLDPHILPGDIVFSKTCRSWAAVSLFMVVDAIKTPIRKIGEILLLYHAIKI